MQLQQNQIEVFEEERECFLKKMEQTLTNDSEVTKAEKESICKDLKEANNILSLEKMEITDRLNKKVIPIKNNMDLMMAIGTYLSGIQNIFIKKCKNYNTIYRGRIVKYESVIFKIFDFSF